MRNPPAGLPVASAPGVETRKDRVVKNIPLATRPPTAASLGEKRRAAMASPVQISTTPMTAEVVPTLNSRYIQDISGELATKGWMASASKRKNFIVPKRRSRNTSP
jgi:hypothetical protein